MFSLFTCCIKLFRKTGGAKPKAFIFQCLRCLLPFKEKLVSVLICSDLVQPRVRGIFFLGLKILIRIVHRFG